MPEILSVVSLAILYISSLWVLDGILYTYTVQRDLARDRIVVVLDDSEISPTATMALASDCLHLWGTLPPELCSAQK